VEALARTVGLSPSRAYARERERASASLEDRYGTHRVQYPSRTSPAGLPRVWIFFIIGAIMARFRIFKKDGTPSPYFWSDKDGSDRSAKTVYKQTGEGVKRMTGVRFNVPAKRIEKQ
jgi:hypothetical protein